MKIHEKYIKRCLEIGENALGIAAPNPMVGSVVVYKDTIIGEGFTSAYGGPHAEVNAINAVNDTSFLKEATLYVSLEPCCHQGKTPPCTNAILASGIKDVVIGIPDPNPLVSGKGIEQLRDAGCRVEVNVHKDACREHHKRFLAFHEKNRPYIILKWAETQDHFMAPKPDLRSGEPEPHWITNKYSRQLVHQWRAEEQAILVGAQTVLADDPLLTVRGFKGSNPVRVVWDTNLEVPHNMRVFNGEAPTIVLSKSTAEENKNVKILKSDKSDLDAGEVASMLYKENITSVIVEGGRQTLESFISSGLWDEARVFRGKITFGGGVTSPSINGRILKTVSIDGDQLTWYRND